MQCTPWPINVSKAETGNNDEYRPYITVFGLIGQKGTHPASVCIPEKWLKWQLLWPASYLIRAPCRPAMLLERGERGRREERMRGKEICAVDAHEIPITSLVS